MRKLRPLRFRRRQIQGLEHFSKVIRELEAERQAAASGKIDALLAGTPQEQWPELVEHPLLNTFGALEYLGKIFAPLVYSQPERAHALAELEISTAENLSPVR